MDRSITFPFSHLLLFLLSLLSLCHLCSTHLSLGPISTIHPKTFRHCPCLSFVFFSVWLLWQQDALGLLLFFWWCRGKCDPTEEKRKIKRTARGIELPGNNFPPLCKSAFIILQWGLLKTPVEKLVCKCWWKAQRKRRRWNLTEENKYAMQQRKCLYDVCLLFEACRSSGFSCGLLDDSKELSVDLWYQSLLGRFNTLPSFLQLRTMALTMVHENPRALAHTYGFATLCGPIDVSDYVSQLFLNFYCLWHDVLLFDRLP